MNCDRCPFYIQVFSEVSSCLDFSFVLSAFSFLLLFPASSNSISAQRSVSHGHQVSAFKRPFFSRLPFRPTQLSAWSCFLAQLGFPPSSLQRKVDDRSGIYHLFLHSSAHLPWVNKLSQLWTYFPLRGYALVLNFKLVAASGPRLLREFPFGENWRIGVGL